MRRLLTFFLALTLFATPSFSQKKDSYRVRTVVIDPGHGGAKPGARGGRIMEKDLVLSIAKKFGKLVADNYPDVKVIYTRTTDVDISLAERAHIANRNKADLFISIHANSHPTATPTGVETFVMGLSESRANLEVAKKENADILLESDYKKNEAYKGFDPNSPESYVMLAMFQNAYLDKSLNFAQAIQNQYKQNIKTINRGVKQAELFVLYKTTCPSVLTEVGFISNPAEEAFMISDEGQAKIAISLFNAFMNYKATEEGTNRIANPKIDIPGAPKSAKVQPEPESKPVVEETPAVAEVKKPAPEEKKPVMTIEEKPEPKPEPVVQNTQNTQSNQNTQNTQSTQNNQNPPTTQPTPTPPTPAAPTALEAPRNTAAANETVFFTVQFLTSINELAKDDAEFKGMKDVMVARNGNLYCYSVGRYATFADASEYCSKVQQQTPFKDAWVVRRQANAVSPVGTQATPNRRVVQTAPEPAPAAQQPAKPAKEDKAVRGIFYRVQYCTSHTIFKAGDSEMHGIRDFTYVRSGNVYIYMAGKYNTVADAKKRCATIKKTTPFKDAFVVGYKNGKRFIVE